MNSNLQKLLIALILELERLEWLDSEAFQVGPDELDEDFDLMPSMDENPVEWDADLPDESDIVNSPICVECGNFAHSCVC